MKSGFPYLVDIGLGTKCPLADTKCNVPCYASSGKDGKEADTSFVSYTLLNTLYSAGVFEVVFGGLEPTLYAHKDGFGHLPYILTYYKNKNFKVGITTRNYQAHKLSTFKEIVGGLHTLAISANSVDDLKEAAVLAEHIRKIDYNVSIYVQNIFGLNDYDSFKLFCLEYDKINKAKYTFSGLTFLGYKDYGRGKDYTPFQIPSEWISFVEKIGITFGIDSLMVSKWKKDLEEHGVDPIYLVGSEGSSSCYVDALKQSVKPSSFTDYEVKLSEKEWRDANRFLEVFRSFKPFHGSIQEFK